MTRHKRAVAWAIALAALGLVAPAQALIVWNGKIVPAWPDEAKPQLPPGAQLAASNIGLYPHPKGVVYGLTLLVDFSDTAPAFSKADIDAWLNQKGYSQGGLNGSVRDYYFDVSNGVVDFQNEIFGFYRAKFAKSHYEAGNDYAGSDELFSEIMDYFDSLVDFSKYDNDGDGRSDAISIVYAGAAETWGQGLWPHASGSSQRRDGVTIARYMMTNLGDSLGLYTFSHEVGHMLFDWPDLYGFGNYCIMGNGGSQKNPVGVNDFYRADQGWIPLVDVTQDTNAVFSAAVNGAGYRYTNPENSNESFFWSNVQSSGRFSSIEGDGLLLLHFDKDLRRNDPPNPLSLAVVQADGKKELDLTTWPEPGSDAQDFFHAGGSDEFSGEKFATANWNDGTASQLHIYDIGVISENMQFKVGHGPIVVEPNGGAASDGGAASAGVNAGGAGALAGSAGEGSAGNTGVGGALAAGLGGSGATPAGGSAGAHYSGMPGSNVESSCACRVGRSPGGLPAGGAVLLVGLLARRSRRRVS